MGLNRSSWAARFANDASCKLLSFAGTVSAMVGVCVCAKKTRMFSLEMDA
jgi:hypothetical protein